MVAFRRGSVPEVVVDGVTGVICDDATELLDAIRAARRLVPADCREHVRRRFDVETMVTGYEQLYRRADPGPAPGAAGRPGAPGCRRAVRTPAAA